MKIFEYSPYFNEKKALEIKLREGLKWIDELHFCEADRTFSYDPKELHFESDARPFREHAARIRHHVLSSEGAFRTPAAQQIYYDPSWGPAAFDRWYWALLTGNAAYHNEAVQRNHALTVLRAAVEDDDVIILSDLDEILDSRLADRIVDETRRHQIITVKLHYSVFYLNLFTASNHGVPDFSYRLYVMTGRYFKAMPFASDYLRKRGIEGGFLNDIHCVEEPMGFHHSWLEHERTAFPKLQAFAANVADRSVVDPGYAAKCVSDRRLHYLDADLYVDDAKPFLRSLQEMDTTGLWL
ncbi:hypothetical protein [Sorangium sp. So ce341]|uniref:hypothetical protein n=1 Tax=Sorangium sp. So ce341 TaxID=3133302 RepID=UPI003F5DD7BC